MTGTEYVNFFVALFAVLDPLGNLAIYIAATRNLSPRVRTGTAFLLSVTIALLLALFLVAGEFLLTFFGITVPAFQIAGGIIILLTGLAMLRGHATGETLAEPKPAEGSARSVLARIMVPVAVPLFVGPGSISITILYGSSAEGALDIAALLGIIIVAVALSFTVLLSAARIARTLGENGLHIATRILGILLTAIAVQFVLDGLTSVWPLLLTGTTVR